MTETNENECKTTSMPEEKPNEAEAGSAPAEPSPAPPEPKKSNTTLKVHEVTPPQKTRTMPVFSVLSFIVAVLFALAFIISVYICFQSVAAQIAMGTPVQGNELAIINAFLTSCALYFAFFWLSLSVGLIYRRLSTSSAEKQQSSSPVGTDNEEEMFSFWDDEDVEGQNVEAGKNPTPQAKV